MQKLKGKTAVVTGSSKGIGAEIALQFAAAGAAVIVNYSSSAEGADRVVQTIVEQGGRAVAVGADVSDAEQRRNLFLQAEAILGHVDILVNNAGVFRYFPLEEIAETSLQWMFGLNVFGLLLTTKDAIALMPPSGGCVINISSLASTSSPMHGTVYSATKAAVDSITRSLAKELGPRKIRVNAIRPGAIETEGTVSGGLISGERLRTFLETTPLGRIGWPTDIAPAATFLASDEASWISGETLLIAGGRGI